MVDEKPELDRHTDPSGLVESLRHADSGQPYLGDLGAVEKIVREFAGEIITRYDEVGHGVLTPEDAANSDRAQALALGKAFAGQDQGYATVRDWSGKPLADELRRRYAQLLQPDDDDAQLIAQRFGLFIHRVYDALRELARGVDAEAVQQELGARARELAQDLVGVNTNG